MWVWLIWSFFNKEFSWYLMILPHPFYSNWDGNPDLSLLPPFYPLSARPPFFLSPLFFSLTRRLPERTPSAQLTSGMPCRPGISSRPVASFIAELGSWRAPMISPFDAESLRFAAAAGWDPVAPRASPHLSAVPSANFGVQPRRVMSRRIFLSVLVPA